MAVAADDSAVSEIGGGKMYSVVDASGEYLTSSGSRTPASNEAATWETEQEAKVACERSTDRVVEND